MSYNSGMSQHGRSINVGAAERLGSIAAGALLLINAIRNRTAASIATGSLGGYLLYRGASGNCALYSALGKKNLANTSKNVQAEVTVRVNRPKQEVYDFWRRLENLPLFMQHLESVTALDGNGNRSRWRAKVPGGLATIEWDAQILQDDPGRMISWTSVADADIENAGKVEFKGLGGNATEIRALISYRAPGGIVGKGLAELLSPVFETMVKNDIQNFKHYMENQASSSMQSDMGMHRGSEPNQSR
ncbi:MAG: SRPBCC family protein [Saprospiraceae bacterium]